MAVAGAVAMARVQDAGSFPDRPAAAKRRSEQGVAVRFAVARGLGPA